MNVVYLLYKLKSCVVFRNKKYAQSTGCLFFLAIRAAQRKSIPPVTWRVLPGQEVKAGGNHRRQRAKCEGMDGAAVGPFHGEGHAVSPYTVRCTTLKI